MAGVDYTRAMARESGALVVAARAAGVDAEVPPCPGWDVHDLVLHASTTHRWAATQVRARATSFRRAELGAVPDDRDAIFDWFAAGAADFVGLLDATDPEEPVWSWGGDHHARFWARRMALETAVHAWDASAAAGSPVPIDGALAVDGLDEALENLPFMATFRPEIAELEGAGETMHLHATDRDGEWLIRLVPDGVEWSHGHAKGDVAARGTASDLWLFAVGRVPPDQLAVFGDRALLDRWQRHFAF